MSSWWRKLIQEMTAEEALIFKDDLTNIYNRRFYKMRLKQAIQKNCSADSCDISFLMLDLDHFKSINDTYGHQVGDQALTHVSTIMKQVVGDRGFVIRYAGDEFLIILPEQGRESSKQIAEDISYSVASKKLKISPQNQALLTLSIGSASSPEDDPAPEALFELADSALYVSKENGRNQVSLVGDKVKSEETLVGNFPCPELVGREAILEHFQEHLVHFKESHAYFIGGITGAGKSRMAQEFVAKIKKEFPVQFRCLESKCEEQEQTAYFSLMNIIDQLLWMEMEEKENLLEGLSEREKYVVGHYFPHIKTVKFLPFENLKSFIKQKDEYFIYGVEKLLNNIAQQKTLVFLFDDVHWMDEYTLGLFFQIIRRGQVPLLLVGFYLTPLKENSSLHVLLSDERLAQLPISTDELARLKSNEILKMIQSIRPKFEPDEEFFSLCEEYTQGNPRKIEAILERLIETQKIFWVGEDCRTQTITPLDFTTALEQVEEQEKLGFQQFPEISEVPTQDLDFNFSAEQIEDTKRTTMEQLAKKETKNSEFSLEELLKEPKAAKENQENAIDLKKVIPKLREIKENEDHLIDIYKSKIRPLLEYLLLFPKNIILEQLLEILAKDLEHEEAEKRKNCLILLKSLSETQSGSSRKQFSVLLQHKIEHRLNEETEANVFSVFVTLIPIIVQDLLFLREYPRTIALLQALRLRLSEDSLAAMILITLEKISASNSLDLLLTDIQGENMGHKSSAIQLLGFMGEASTGSLINIILHSDNFRTRMACITALKETKSNAVQLLTQLLSERTNPKSYCRILSLDDLLPADPKFQRLEKSLLHPEEEVRNQGLMLLLRKEKEEYLHVFSRVIPLAQGSVFEHLIEEFEQLQLKEVAGDILKVLQNNRSPQVSKLCIETLTKFKYTPAIDVFRKIAQETPQSTVALSAIQGLERIQHSKAKEALIELEKISDFPDIWYAAIHQAISTYET